MGQDALPPVAEPHQTVLLREAVDALQPTAEGLYVDATFGRGGHSRALLASLGPVGRLLAFDRDPQAVAHGEGFADARLRLIHSPFSEVEQVLDREGMGPVDGLIADLGVSSPQLDQAERGFSFLRDGPLDMRMDPSRGLSAADWLASASPAELEEVIRDYGEERHARAIAGAIVAQREAAAAGEAEPLRRTGQLASLVEQTLRRCRAKREPGHHPATRTFQALRIYLNQELAELETLLRALPRILKPGARAAIISFHSLEDRLVKQTIKALSTPSRVQRPAGMGRGQFALLAEQDDRAAGAEISLRPVARIYPSSEEVARNPRARSAVMRVVERLASAQPTAGERS